MTNSVKAPGDSLLWVVMQWTVSGEMLMPSSTTLKLGLVWNDSAAWMSIQTAIEQCNKSTKTFQLKERIIPRSNELFLRTNENVNLMRRIHIASPKRPYPSCLLPNRPHSSSPSSALQREPAFNSAIIKYSKRNNLKDLLLAIGNGCRHYRNSTVDGYIT